MVTRSDERGSHYGVGFLLGVLAGTALGAGIAFLLAPKTGEALRNDIRKAAERSAEHFRKASAARAGESTDVDS
jgi:gas vesicle protein